jgi:hypothetical protein
VTPKEVAKMMRRLVLFALAAAGVAVLVACAGSPAASENAEWQKPNPPEWAYVANSSPDGASPGVRFFLRTKPSLDPPDGVKVFVRSQNVDAGKDTTPGLRGDNTIALMRFGRQITVPPGW